MKLKISFIFFSISFFFSHSQEKAVLLDNIKKQPISYATIYYLKSKKGHYTNDKGFFEFNKKKIDSIYISCLGYKTLKITTNIIKDTIFLNPDVIELSEIEILKKRIIENKIGFKKSKNYWYGGKYVELGVIIKPKFEFENSFIKEFILPLKKKKPRTNNKNNKFNSVIKIGVFTVKNNLPYQNILKKNILINYNQDSEQILKIDLTDEDILFTKEGLFFNIVLVGEINKNGEVISESFPLPGIICTTKKTKDFSYIKALYKRKFLTNWSDLTYDKLLMDKPIYPSFKIIVSNYYEK